jgi:hypothetical protein
MYILSKRWQHRFFCAYNCCNNRLVQCKKMPQRAQKHCFLYFLCLSVSVASKSVAAQQRINNFPDKVVAKLLQ